MSRRLPVEPLTAAAFAPFGEVIETTGVTPLTINEGFARRFDTAAKVDVSADGGGTRISLFAAKARRLPIAIRMLERHPLGSQAFMPLSGNAYLVVVAPAEDAAPFDRMRAFRARPDQGVNYRRNVWHHPLLALQPGERFLVVDRIGPGDNLEEVWFENRAAEIELTPNA